MDNHHSNIIRINTAYSNTYLIRTGESSILVDTGLDRSGQLVLQGMSREGIHPSDIKLIIITHSHFDHCRGARAIQEATGAVVMVQSEDAANFTKGFGRLPRGITWPLEAWVSMGRTFMPRIGHFPPVQPDVLVKDRLDLSEYGIEGYVMHTPGHTRGSLSVIIEEKHGIVGDTVIGRREKSIFPPFADDPSELIRSWKKLMDAGVEYLYPGHGHPFRSNRLSSEYDIICKRYKT